MALYLIIGIILFLTLYCVRINAGRFSEALAFDKSNTMKGLLALIIVFHHLVLECNGTSKVLEIFKYLGFPLVSVFFFFSGYGLIKSYYKNGKKLSLKAYAVKRLTRLLIPYAIVVFSYGLYRFFQNPGSFALNHFLTDVFLAREIGPFWYMTVIIFLYTLFGICFRFFNPVAARRIILISTVAYITVCILFSVPSQWYSSVIGFYIGIIYGVNEDIVTDYLNTGYNVKVLLLFVSFAVLFCMRLIISLLVTDSEFLHGVLRSIIDVLFIAFFVSFCRVIEIKRTALILIGNISYEIYIIHPVVMYILKNKIHANTWYCLIAFVSSICLAYILNALNKQIFKMIL